MAKRLEKSPQHPLKSNYGDSVNYCMLEDCNKKYNSGGLCAMHYARYKRTGRLDRVRRYNSTSYDDRKAKYPLYPAWYNAIRRTTDKNHKHYAHYGGRGICMCGGWKSSLPQFSEDIGQKPSPEHSIDRIDNDGNYSCGKCTQCTGNGWSMNVRWATKSQQSINRRRRKNLTGYIGVRKSYNKYHANIQHDKKLYNLGIFNTAIEAAQAYNKAAIKLHGEDARLNIIS